jgi:hypothetical protein
MVQVEEYFYCIHSLTCLNSEIQVILQAITKNSRVYYLVETWPILVVLSNVTPANLINVLFFFYSSKIAF